MSGAIQSAIAMTGLFRQLLGERFQQLAPRVREIHDGSSRSLRGTATVTRGTNPIARVICRVASLPRAQHEGPMRIDLEAAEGGELWTRHFGASRPMRSRLRAADGLLEEQLGLVRLRFRLQPCAGAIEWRLQSVNVLGVPAPRHWLAGTEARSSEREGYYCFEVDVTLPVIGHVIGYKGRIDDTTSA